MKTNFEGISLQKKKTEKVFFTDEVSVGKKIVEAEGFILVKAARGQALLITEVGSIVAEGKEAIKNFLTSSTLEVKKLLKGLKKAFWTTPTFSGNFSLHRTITRQFFY